MADRVILIETDIHEHSQKTEADPNAWSGVSAKPILLIIKNMVKVFWSKSIYMYIYMYVSMCVVMHDY